MPKLIGGTWTGTMNLTEPQAGSDVGALRCRAVPDGERYLITGQKIFITNAILATLKWIHSHTPEEIMAKMPDELIGPDKALYLAALKNTIPMYSLTGMMDPKGADAVLAVFSEGSPEVAKANIDVTKTWTNKYVEQVKKTTGTSTK